MLRLIAILFLAGEVSQPTPSPTPVTPVSPQPAPAPGNFAFADTPKKPATSYPWKEKIVTTVFWIGESSSKAGAWDENWQRSNNGSDSPDDRNGYGAGAHASTVNPFYVALPFNDLAFPDKAKQWVPADWHRPPRDGKPVSACQHRWVEIKNAQGRVCYAQWEDVGPVRNDHAEYVFGIERPGTTAGTAGLDVSPAVADYLSLDKGTNLTSWRFVDDTDIPPGQWLKYDEQAVIYAALHQLKNSDEKPKSETKPVAPAEAKSTSADVPDKP